MTVGVHHGDPPEQQSLVLVPGDSGRHLVRSVGPTRTHDPSAISNERQQLRRPDARTAGYVQHDTVKVEGSRKVLFLVADPEAISAFLQRRLAQEPSGVPKEPHAWLRAA